MQTKSEIRQTKLFFTLEQFYITTLTSSKFHKHTVDSVRKQALHLILSFTNLILIHVLKEKKFIYDITLKCTEFIN